MQHSVSVVIPNYNGKHLLEEYLPYTIAALKKAGTDHEIIISDDASTDDSVKFIQEKYPEIKIVRSEANKGFSHTVNNGIQSASKTLVLLLNSDVKLKEDYFQYQWKYFEDPNTFGVMGSIWTEDGKRLMDAAKYPVWKGGQLRSTVNYTLKQKNKEPLLTLFLSGANALVDREKLIKLGGMDTRYSPFYMEDVDLSVCAWRSGWKCYYEQDATCYHKLSETISNNNSKKKISYISRRNKFIFHHSHLSGAKRLFWQLENMMNLVFRGLISDIDYYRAFSEYREIVNSSDPQINYSRSLEEITSEIINANKGLEKELF